MASLVYMEPVSQGPILNMHVCVCLQVIGRKYIKLFPSDQTPYLYPHEGILSNTSQVSSSAFLVVVLWGGKVSRLFAIGFMHALLFPSLILHLYITTLLRDITIHLEHSFTLVCMSATISGLEYSFAHTMCTL